MQAKAIHIAMIIQVYLPHVGGAERQLSALAPLLQQRNVKLSVITRRLRGYRSYEEIDGVSVYRIPSPNNKIIASLLYSVLSIPLLMYLKPDIMHAHELLSPTTTAVLARPFVRAPIVAKVLRGGMLGDIGKLKSKSTGQARFDRFRKNVDMFIAISQEIVHELRENGVDDSQQIFIPNGVDTCKFIPLAPEQKISLRHRLGLPQNAKIITFSGRLDPEKRLDLLLDLWSSIQQRFPETHLVFVGTGSHEDEYKSTASTADTIQFVGSVENVHEYLQASDIFVLPSMTEGLSNSLLEAMATGLAVIATEVGGTPDVLQHQHSGLMIEAGNKDVLFEALVSLLEDEALCKHLGEQARNTVQENYALATTADQLRALYDRLLSREVTL